MIRTVQEGDYLGLVELYKNFFPTHNRFQEENGKIVSYLKEQASKNLLLVFDQDKIKGAMFLVNFGSDSNNSHKLWKFRHFAFDDENVAKELLQEAENKVQESSQTSKIELTIAETEPGKEFYLNNGYQQEAALINHYRWNETCFVLAKSFGPKNI
ncbi:hypothetical protein HOI26_00225 [Candidatus Woesearchaeota archaeon]|jgi:hypothetical protein|nr:hypothetical protein [Candidatus Woesearchaeota archaeon]